MYSYFGLQCYITFKLLIDIKISVSFFFIFAEDISINFVQHMLSAKRARIFGLILISTTIFRVSLNMYDMYIVVKIRNILTGEIKLKVLQMSFG